MFLFSYKNLQKRLFIVTLSILILLSIISVSFASEEESIVALRNMGKAFSSIAGQASPAVVGVTTERIVIQASTLNPFGEDFEDFLWGQRRGSRQQRRNQGQPSDPEPQQRITPVQGSGFIISPDGYILTNYHLVEDANKIEIELNENHSYTAAITGSDPDSDIAVIKIDANDLPYLELGNSDALEVGEWVLAIGNPLTLSHTVTAGIVSAKGRTGFGLNALENYIQTDAAINFGNSGGPLLNLDGKVVGINTAIASSTGNIGIGFAVPINMANYAYKQILKTGTVERGLLGIREIYSITPQDASDFGLEEDSKGVFFKTIIRNSAADKAGLTKNDVILEIDGKPIETFLDLQSIISMLEPGTIVELTIWRNAKREKLDVELGKRSAVDQLEMDEMLENAYNLLGFKVRNIDEDTAERYSHEVQDGVVVTEIKPNSIAFGRISVGAVIKEVNRMTVRDINDFARLVDAAQQGETESVLLWVNINGENSNVFLRLP